MSSNSKNSIPVPGGRGLAPANNLITSAAVALRLHRRVNLARAFRSSLQTVSCLGFAPVLKDICQARALQFAGSNYFQWSFHALSATLMSLSFFNGDEIRSDSRDVGKSFSWTSRNDLFGKRQWTNILLAANVLAYMAQTVSEGKLLFWGAKINSLISEGQLWRLATSSFLHANIGHLMVNCYSLNSVGPTVENICGPKRYLAIYITSAIASSATSYWFCKAPAVGASGAIFGLVGSFALFILRHRGIITGSESELRQIAKVIVLNMPTYVRDFKATRYSPNTATLTLTETLYHGLFSDFLRAQGCKFIDIVNQAIGLLSQGIDNWGHVGGLLGGAAVSWFLGPAWKIESISRNGRKVLTDKAPIFSLFKNR